MQAIADWLEKLGMSEYAQRFAENNIGIDVLSQLSGSRNPFHGDWERRAAQISAKANVSASKFWTSDDRAPRGHRERHAKKEWSAKARNHPRVASALPHSEGIAYKPLCGEIAMCSRVGRMGSIK